MVLEDAGRPENEQAVVNDCAVILSVKRQPLRHFTRYDTIIKTIPTDGPGNTLCDQVYSYLDSWNARFLSLSSTSI